MPLSVSRNGVLGIWYLVFGIWYLVRRTDCGELSQVVSLKSQIRFAQGGGDG